MSRKTKSRPKARDELSQHSAIRLAPQMYATLKALADRHGQGLGEEIRARLAESLDIEERPVETQRLLAVVRRLLTGQLSEWHRSPAICAALKEAVAYALDAQAPKKDSTGSLSGAVALLARDNPKTFGQIAAGQAIAETAKEFLPKQRTK